MVFLKLNKDLTKYLDNLTLNYKIAISDHNKLIYNNLNEDLQELSKEFKILLNTLYKEKEIMNFFNDTKNEKINLEISSKILNESIKNKENNSKTFDNLVSTLLFTTENNIKILKNDNFKNYPLKCIIPINNDCFTGSIIILTNDSYIEKEIKESFFRFCVGLYFIINHYITNCEYNEHKLLK